MLAKDKELFFNAVIFILEELYIVDTLLKLFVIFFLKSINIKYEEMPIIASDPS